jgi:cellulose synthase/poly-beta-1,6-N-acetylglucosamine synthase-like glycosyltransferase
VAALADVLLCLAAVPVLLASAYLLLLTLASGRRPAPPPSAPHLRFDVVVPAHDEEAGIAATVRSVLATDYPPALRRVLVVADNCTDATAARAEEAGATVLVRHDPDRRGKGYALAHAFARVLGDGTADAVVVVDADTLVSPNLLVAFAARLEGGAVAIQSDNGVQNPNASWRTRLMAVAFSLVNTLRSLGRERLGCSAGLRGTGMCLSTRILRSVPYDCFSLVEDVEYGIRLGTLGHRVRFAGEARVVSEMATGSDASRSQRARWEGGRRELARRHARALLRAGIARRDRVLLDLGLDLLVPPLAGLGAAAALGLVASSVASRLAGHVLTSTWVWAAGVAALATYVARGWWLSGTGFQGLQGLLFSPVYLVWKVGLRAFGAARPGDAWVRTARDRRP